MILVYRGNGGRAGDFRNPPDSIHGLGNDLGIIKQSIGLLVMGVQKETVIETCSAAYGRICMDYSTVPFNDMDPNDEDFKFFFDYKEMLDELGRGLKFFFDRCHKEKFNVLNEWPEYKEVGLIIKKIGGRDYASEILQKYGLEFSESAPSK